MIKKRAIILGGGISGLALRYYLSQKYSDGEILLLEKKHRLGGIIESQSTGDFFFEKGPRTFKVSKSGDLLRLIFELGLESDILVSEKKTQRRFLWKGGDLYPLPLSALSFLTSSLTRPLIPSLLREWRQRKGEGDESIHNFAKRRLSAYAAKTLFDPMTLGIYGGDIRKLSMISCYPKLKEMEQKYGSITKAFLRKPKQPSSLSKKLPPSSLFTLRHGIESLILKLQKEGGGEIYLKTAARDLMFQNSKVIVNNKWETDHLFCALPAQSVYQLTKRWDPRIHAFYKNLRCAPLSAVHLGYPKELLDQKGFGYLIPSSERESILGGIFDSCVFPEQNRHEKETRLTIMMGGAFRPKLLCASKKERLMQALEKVSEHLNISTPPLYTQVVDYPEGIPQFTLGHQARVEKLRHLLKESYPQVTLLGNYLEGVSVSHCIGQAKRLAGSFRFSF